LIASEPIGWVNTGLPMAVLAGAAVILPRLLVPGDTRSQRAVTVSVLSSAVGLLLLGAAVFAAVYSAGGAGVASAFSNAPMATGLFFLRLSAMAALLWVPVLALVWFAMAQAVEVRRGEDVMRGAS
jgi:hypothetical protein